MQRVTITSTHYHTRYCKFSPSLAWFGAISNSIPSVTFKYIKKTYINIFSKKLTVTRGNPLQIAQNQTNLRENIR